VSRYDAVIFDLDGTLCRNVQDLDAAYRRAFDAVGLDPLGEPTELWGALEGPPDPDDRVGYLATGFARLLTQHGVDGDPLDLAAALLAEFDATQVAFLPDAERVLARLRGRYRLGVLTNGPRRHQAAKVEALGLADRVDAVVYAGDLPRRKPLPLPFETICDRLTVEPGRALYVGDSLAHDVAGAGVAGLDAAWIRTDGAEPAPYRPRFVLDSLGDLLDELA